MMEPRDLVIDYQGYLYLSYFSNRNYMITKIYSNSTIVWSINSNVDILEHSMSVSNDCTQLIFTDGIYKFV